MEKILTRWIINTIAILIAIHFVPGIIYTGTWWEILLVAIIFGLVNSFIRPFIKLFTLPLIIFTLGLFTFVINAMMLSMTSSLSKVLGLGFYVDGFKPALCGALIISIVSIILSSLSPPAKVHSS